MAAASLVGSLPYPHTRLSTDKTVRDHYHFAAAVLPSSLPATARAEHVTVPCTTPSRAELAGLVLSRLPAYSDRVRFGAVCHHWNFSFSSMKRCLPKPLPCLACPDGTFFCLPRSESCRFPGTTSYHSSCGEWLLFLHDGACYLKDPFSKITLTLPNLSSLCPIDEPVEIINGPVSSEDEVPPESLNMDADMLIDKLIVCSELIVAATIKIGPHKTVALCRPGDDSWLVSRLGSKVTLFDIMFYEGKLYVLDESRDLLVIIVWEDDDNGKLSISRIECLIENETLSFSLIHNGVSYLQYFLVECNGALLLLSRTIYGMPSDGDSECTPIKPVGVGFEVFKVDFRSVRWEDVTSIGDDVVLFVSKSYSQSVSVSQYKVKGNCIWFCNCSWF
ncbi:hypothetical protein PR202_gb25166 [Eleusine coracana subsp. coracana]|uniref:KIB1-4 beta-propeller domain-containing protein n=1 Tax=Eleusine coracana subsp. coracana TaxID=191504 RepID=A0AAV5FN01_ELECO|nr:hypothetical protein PR202_gb25166 [Eleusine coracana subsp. coracana]